MSNGLRLSVVSTGGDVIIARLERMKAPSLHKPISRFLLRAGFLVLKEAAENQIIRGGEFGKGKNRKSSPPDPRRLTSRSGELRRSLGSDSRYQGRGMDRDGLPRYIDVGSDLEYAVLHESGGTITIKAHARSGRTKHLKRSVLGPISTIGADHPVKSHTATYPARPFLGPAVEVVAGQLFLDALTDELEAHFEATDA